MKCHNIITLILLAATLNGQTDSSNALAWALGGQVADLISTQIILAGNGVELNPLMHSQPVFISTKIGLCLVFYIYARQYPENKRAMIVFAALSWLPVVYNLMQATTEREDTTP